MSFLLWLTQAWALSWPFDEPAPRPEALPFQGVFSDPPAFQFRAPLPGGTLNAATHSEWTQPVVAGADVLVGSAAGTALFALSRTNGAVRRVFPAESSVEAPPVVSGSRVYFSDTAGNTYCYDLASAELRWKHDGAAPYLVAPTVAEEDGLLLVTSVDDVAVALELDSGDLVWQYKPRADPTRQSELALYAATRAVVDGGAAIVGFSTGDVAAIELSSGKVLWAKEIGEGRYPDVVADPIVDGPDVFAGGYFRPLVAIDQPSGQVRWRVDAGAANAAALDRERGLLFHPGSDGVLRAVATLSGAQAWRWDSGTTGALTTPVQTPAGLVVASSAGSIYLIEPDTGAELWRWRENYLLSGISAQPTVYGRQLLFVSNDGTLYSMLAAQSASL